MNSSHDTNTRIRVGALQGGKGMAETYMAFVDFYILTSYNKAVNFSPFVRIEVQAFFSFLRGVVFVRDTIR